MATHSLIWLTLVACCLALTAAFPAAEQTGHSVQKRQIPASSTAVDAALRNPRFMRRQISCLLGEGNCDNIGRNLRELTPSLLNGECPRCTLSQFQQAMKVMRHVSQVYPAEYSRIYYSYKKQN